MSDEHESSKPISDELQETSLLPLVLTPTNNYQVREVGSTPSYWNRIYLIRQTFLSEPTDPSIIFNNVDTVFLDELVFRQNRYTCLSSEVVTIESPYTCTDSVVEGRYGDYNFTPDYDTLEKIYGGRAFDEGANIGLAYVLVRRAIVEGKVSQETVKAGVEKLSKSAERVGVNVFLPNLRTTMLRLVDKRTLLPMIEKGYVSEAELPVYFECLARWQLELARKTIENTPRAYINPHPYSAILETKDDRLERREIMPDARYLPAVFRIHKEYLDNLLKSAGELVVIEPSKVNSSVKELYEFAGRTIAFYPRPLEEKDQHTVNEVEELATTMSPEFSNLVRQFNNRFRKQPPIIVPDPVVESSPPEHHGPNRFREYLRKYGASAANRVRKKPGLGLRDSIPNDEN